MSSVPDAPSVRHLVAERARDPRPAYVEGRTGRCLTWVDVAARAATWERAAAGLGRVGPGRWADGARSRARVGLACADPLEMAAAVIGALAAGVCVAPLDATSAPTDLVARAGLLGLSAVVGVGDELGPAAGALHRAGIDRWLGGRDLVAVDQCGGGPAGSGGTGAGGPVRPGGAPSADAGLLLASSGTSGPPKLIPLQTAALVATAGCVVDHHRLGPDDCGYSPLPLTHINGLVVGVLAALVGGHRLVVDRRFSASSYWDVVAGHGVTWLNAVPAILSVLCQHPAPPRSLAAGVAFARSASAPLAVATLERWEARTGIPVLETYGMTEAGSQITAMPRAAAARRPGSVGVAVGVELRVVGPDGRAAPTGTVGAVEIRGERIVSTYWAASGAQPATRPATGADGWLRTGDLGALDADGYLTLAGRADDVINRGGEKVYPQEIEAVLLADPGVAAAAVVGRPDPIVGEVPVAFVVAVPGGTAAGLVARLERRVAGLSRVRRPAEIIVVGALPCGLNGKIRRAELRQLVGTRR
jgi:acyl-CoA synthetase (AMP-forming)/AMP-acid ligase II